MSRSGADARWMARAIALAERGRADAPPNPHVGCVLVRDGVVVAEGWTAQPGGPHAEARALRAAGGRASGTTAYVTLEPCAHHGRTPPCAPALVAAGVRRVVAAIRDPNPVAAGGMATLGTAGVDVEVGVLGDWVRRQLQAFLVDATTGRPYVTLKMAQTLDGDLSAPSTRWVTGPRARRRVHQLRARADAVLVGRGTVLADDPRLDVRHVASHRGQPRAVVFDTHGRTPVEASVVRPSAVLVTVDAPADWQRAVEEAVAQVVTVGADDRGRVSIIEALPALRHLGIQTVLAEPGQDLATSLLAAGAVDRVVQHTAPRVVAGDGVPRMVAALEPTAGWPIRRWQRLGEDVETVRDRPSDPTT